MLVQQLSFLTKGKYKYDMGGDSNTIDNRDAFKKADYGLAVGTGLELNTLVFGSCNSYWCLSYFCVTLYPDNSTNYLFEEIVFIVYEPKLLIQCGQNIIV